MARKFPKDLDPSTKQLEIKEKLKQNNSSYDKINLKIDFISPYFGGGTEAGKNDNEKLIRETSIRGQLRFWWRATIGSTFSDSKKMKEIEDEIFGSTKKASRVIIKVNNIVDGNNIFKSYDGNNSTNSYVLFPFRATRTTPQIDGKEKISFNLSITIKETKDKKELSVDEINKQLQKILKAWINFGGLGARTRRGLGSLYCEEFAFKDINELKDFVNQNQNTSFPTINRIFYSEGGDWTTTTKLLKFFRQEKFCGRRKGTGLDRRGRPKMYGRSYWPEPDTIGSVFPRKKESEQEDHTRRVTQENSFPRAEFGLPIIIDFRDLSEAPAIQVIPVVDEKGKKIEKERFSSPLIMKNIKLSNKKDYQIVILLNGIQSLKNVKLKILSDKDFAKYISEKKRKGININDNEIKETLKNTCYPINWAPQSFKNKNETPLTENGSAIQGFISFIKNNNFKEINGGSK